MKQVLQVGPNRFETEGQEISLQYSNGGLAEAWTADKEVPHNWTGAGQAGDTAIKCRHDNKVET